MLMMTLVMMREAILGKPPSLCHTYAKRKRLVSNESKELGNKIDDKLSYEKETN